MSGGLESVREDVPVESPESRLLEKPFSLDELSACVRLMLESQ
jgi:hypothetical protein